MLQPPVEPEQYTSIAFTDRLMDQGIDPSVGSVGDAYDNALAESQIGLYKTELIHHRGPWRGRADVELTPVEVEQFYYSHQQRLTEAA